MPLEIVTPGYLLVVRPVRHTPLPVAHGCVAGDPDAFEADNRHFLYKEYLRIIRQFGPAVFVMENVKGILSSTHGGSPIFGRILEDLAKPGNGLEYDIRSFVTSGHGESIKPKESEAQSSELAVCN